MHAERRNEPRRSFVRPCKVFHRASHQFAPASTADMSDSGLRVACELKRPLNVGDRVEVGIAWEGELMLRADRMVVCTVRHVAFDDDGRQTLGLALDSASLEAAA